MKINSLKQMEPPSIRQLTKFKYCLERRQFHAICGEISCLENFLIKMNTPILKKFRVRIRT